MLNPSQAATQAAGAEAAAAQAVPAPDPPAAPLPQPSRVTVTTMEDGQGVAIHMPGAEMSVEQVRGLEALRSELNDQLRDAQNRRREVASELHGADPAARPGIEQRLKVIDDRIVQIENRITETGQQLTSLPAGVAMAAERQARIERANASGGDDELWFFFGSALSAGLIMLVLGFRRWRRRGRRREMEAVGGIGSERFTRLEQAVDAIAVEVERISEGQRFTAKLMAEGGERLRREAVPRDPGAAY